MQRPKELNLDNPHILVTIHRQENTDDKERLWNIISSLNTLTEEGNNILWPIHPRTKKIIENHGWIIKFDCIAPVGYLGMLYMLENSKLVITDSGGLQKEAYFFNKYCLTLRDSTEWIELLENKVNTLINVNSETLLDDIKKHLNNKIDNSTHLYGFGNTSEIIVNQLLENFV